MEPLSYTTEELAAQLHLQPSTLAAWRASGRGPRAIRAGRRLIYPSWIVKEWMESQPDRGYQGAKRGSFGPKRGQSDAKPGRNGAQNAAQPVSVEPHAHSCAACGTIGHTDNDSARPAGWIARDNRQLCVACSYVS